MSDLEERLRSAATSEPWLGEYRYGLLIEAADEIESLRAKLAAVEARHYEGVSYADDMDYDDVPEDYERHWCNEDGETWPCATIAAIRSQEPPTGPEGQ